MGIIKETSNNLDFHFYTMWNDKDFVYLFFLSFYISQKKSAPLYVYNTRFQHILLLLLLMQGW